MKTLFITTFFCLSILSCGQENVKGNGNRISETRTVSSNFTSVASSGSFDIVINDSPQDGKIILEGDSNILEKINVEVKDDKLIIELKKGFNLHFSKTIQITLNAKNLKSLALSGSGSILAKGTQNVSSFSAAISGSGDIDARVSAKDVTASISGSGDIVLAGNTESLNVGISGSGDIKAFQLKSKDVTIKVSGSGDTQVTVENSLLGGIAGSGDIQYKGNPSKIKINASGSGDVTQVN